MGKVYVVVEKVENGLNILCVEESNTYTVTVERDDDYARKKIKPNQLLSHVEDCVVSWGKKCRTLKEFTKVVGLAVSMVDIDGDEEIAVGDVFACLNLKEFRERFKLSFEPEEVVVCVPLRYYEF